MTGIGSMTNLSKNLIIGAMVASGLVVLAAVLDLAIQLPFGRTSVVMDVLFLVSAAVVLYMAWEAYRELA